MGKRIAGCLFLTLLWTICLTGCVPGPSDQTLYRLPKLPAEYESLETLIDGLLSGGAEYAAPTSGSNLQSVQMVDLDGDGEEEAVAFLRRASDERPMKIYIFRSAGASYVQYCVIEGTSNSIYSVSYVDLNGDGWREILAGTRGDLDVQNLAVYSVSSPEPQQLLLTGYSRYAARDLDGDSRQDLVVLRSDEENLTVADYYSWDGEALTLGPSLHLSSTVAELNRLSAGVLAGGENALFVTAVTEDNAAMTDILVMRDGALQNVSGSSGNRSCRFLELYPSDVNSDGITEVPIPVPFMQTDPEAPAFYRICWRQYDGQGNSALVRETFQDTQAGWSLILPEGWEDVTVSRSSSADGSSVTFARVAGQEPEPFLTIYAFTGYNRTQLASRAGRLMLSRQAEVTYAAMIYGDGMGRIDEASLRERFGLTAAEWATGEN